MHLKNKNPVLADVNLAIAFGNLRKKIYKRLDKDYII